MGTNGANGVSPRILTFSPAGPAASSGLDLSSPSRPSDSPNPDAPSTASSRSNRFRHPSASAPAPQSRPCARPPSAVQPTLPHPAASPVRAVPPPPDVPRLAPRGRGRSPLPHSPFSAAFSPPPSPPSPARCPGTPFPPDTIHASERRSRRRRSLRTDWRRGLPATPRKREDLDHRGPTRKPATRDPSRAMTGTCRWHRPRGCSTGMQPTRPLPHPQVRHGPG